MVFGTFLPGSYATTRCWSTMIISPTRKSSGICVEAVLTGMNQPPLLPRHASAISTLARDKWVSFDERSHKLAIIRNEKLWVPWGTGQRLHRPGGG